MLSEHVIRKLASLRSDANFMKLYLNGPAYCNSAKTN